MLKVLKYFAKGKGTKIFSAKGTKIFYMLKVLKYFLNGC